MRRVKGETLLLDTMYRPDPGAFCRPRAYGNGRYEAGSWHLCRELWHFHLRDLPIFFYSHEVGKTDAIAAFLARVEDQLGTNPRTVVGPTQRKAISWVSPSRWWTRPAMPRSLFTILLRQGEKYRPADDNFDDALYGHRYTRESAYAVGRFMAGNTKYTGRKRGWFSQFAAKFVTEAEVDRLLVSR